MSNKSYEPIPSKPESTIDVLDRIQEVQNIKSSTTPKKDYNSIV